VVVDSSLQKVKNAAMKHCDQLCSIYLTLYEVYAEFRAPHFCRRWNMRCFIYMQKLSLSWFKRANDLAF
jgi:hypothetical protein